MDREPSHSHKSRNDTFFTQNVMLLQGVWRENKLKGKKN